MGFLDKAKAAAEQAAAKAKEVGDDLQTKRELDKAYTELGKTTFDLIESGGLAHEQLEEQAAKIRALRLRAAGDGGSEVTAEPEASEPVGAPETPA
jgi:hypothetical protein